MSSEDGFRIMTSKLQNKGNFWLDGHYSGDITFFGKEVSPVQFELDEISRILSKLNGIAIIIDDCRLFNGVDGYPNKTELVKWANIHGLEWTVEHDIFVMKKGNMFVKLHAYTKVLTREGYSVQSDFVPAAFKVGFDVQKIASKVNGKKVLVTGGASFIGSHLVEALVTLGADVVVVDDFSSGSKDNLTSVLNEITLVEADIRSLEFKNPIFSNLEGVFHLAAVHGGRGFIEKFPFDCALNVSIDAAVIELAVANDASWFTFASSACTYPTREQGIGARNLLSEHLISWEPANGIEPDGYYGWAKMYGEVLLSSAVKQSGLTGTAARIFTAYGERENESHAAVALLLKGMLRLDPFPIWGDGTQTRNFTYVGDTVAGLLATLLYTQGMNALNIGTQSHVTVNEFCQEVFRQTNWTPKNIEYQINMPRGVASRASDNEKILSLADWQPTTSIDLGIKQMIDYWTDRLHGYDVAQLEKKLMAR